MIANNKKKNRKKQNGSDFPGKEKIKAKPRQSKNKANHRTNSKKIPLAMVQNEHVEIVYTIGDKERKKEKKN